LLKFGEKIPLVFHFAVCYNLLKYIIGGEDKMLIKGIIEEMFDNEAIVIFEEYNFVFLERGARGDFRLQNLILLS